MAIRTHPRPRAASPLPQRDRGGVHWLTGAETAVVVAMVMTAFAAGRSAYQAFYEALAAGEPVASLARWYRIARTHAAACRPARRRTGARPEAPELAATQLR